MKVCIKAAFVLALSLVEGFTPNLMHTNLARSSSGKNYRHVRFLDTSSSSTSVQMESSIQDNMLAEPELSLSQSASYGIIEQNERSWDSNTLINNGIVLGLAAILFKMALIDADVSRGWTTAEILQRIPSNAWHSYSSVLTSNPIPTKAATSASVYAVGDVIAQRMEGKSMGDIDRLRTLRSLTAGLIGHGPLSHFWYNFSENLFDNVLHWTAAWSIVPKIALDQALWGPIWNNTYLLLLGLMKMESLEDIWGDMKRTTVPLLLSGLKLWPLAHVFTYGLIPVENRLLFVDAVEILWVTILASSAAGNEQDLEVGAEKEAEELVLQ